MPKLSKKPDESEKLLNLASDIGVSRVALRGEDLAKLSSESDSSLGESSISGDDETLKVRAGGLKQASPKKRSAGGYGVPELDNSSSLDSDSGLLNDSS
eukprot:CAMPEP_0118662956 /NCGR_PEP_ID=MMETSP0785-20121206/17124_1 /TAXON_ID=91992 /ORGANISM="Bolidomonas pacifica, Strain CCMP 1866" /LENGTH=98 /DNA_ID=CAMNT_0006556567 /DNA_START=74 /DNA_END=367 /DNA_ORIENTATION=-